MIALWIAAIAAYAISVVYRAKLLTWTKFCHDVKHCRRKHKVVFVAPPNKPARAVLKHY